MNKSGNTNKGKGNGAGMAFNIITHAHSFGTDTQHDYSQGSIAEQCRQLKLSLNNE